MTTVGNPKKTLHLLLVNHHEMVGERLARVLESEEDLRVVGECSSSTETQSLELIQRKVDVLLLHVRSGERQAPAFVEAVRKQSFKGQILVVTTGLIGSEAVRLLQAGVDGIVHGNHSSKELGDAIRQVASGKPLLEEQYVASLIRSVDRTRPPLIPKLTDRDRALLRHVLAGLTNREIATLLKISEGAVKASLRLLFDKVKVKSREQLVKIALEQYQDQL